MSRIGLVGVIQSNTAAFRAVVYFGFIDALYSYALGMTYRFFGPCTTVFGIGGGNIIDKTFAR